MSVIQRFRRSLGFSPGGTDNGSLQASPTRRQSDKEQDDPFAETVRASSSSSPMRAAAAKMSSAGVYKDHGNPQQESAQGHQPVLAYFVLESNAGTEKVRYPIRKHITRIGRLPTNDIRIYRETVSRLHCEVHIGGDVFSPERVIALHVYNQRGVEINGKALEQGADKTTKEAVIFTLYEGDVLEIYGNFFRLRLPSFHSYSPQGSPSTSRQPLGTAQAPPQQQQTQSSPQSQRKIKPCPRPSAASLALASCSKTQRAEGKDHAIPNVNPLSEVKGKRRISLFAATPKREAQQSVPWSAEPVKAQAHRRIPSGGPTALGIITDQVEEAIKEVEVGDLDKKQSKACGREDASHCDKKSSTHTDKVYDESRHRGVEPAERASFDDSASSAQSEIEEDAPLDQSEKPSMRRSQSLSPKKVKRRSTFFGRAGVFSNWNFGFYPEERRSKADDEDCEDKEDRADAENGSISPSPISFQHHCIPQPRLDENGRPRLPRSISSPDFRHGSPKRRIVSLRTATLLKAGQDAFERQKLLTPPASPTKAEQFKPSHQDGIIVAPASTPEEEEDEAEVDDSLAILDFVDEATTKSDRDSPKAARKSDGEAEAGAGVDDFAFEQHDGADFNKENRPKEEHISKRSGAVCDLAIPDSRSLTRIETSTRAPRQSMPVNLERHASKSAEKLALHRLSEGTSTDASSNNHKCAEITRRGIEMMVASPSDSEKLSSETPDACDARGGLMRSSPDATPEKHRPKSPSAYTHLRLMVQSSPSALAAIEAIEHGEKEIPLQDADFFNVQASPASLQSSEAELEQGWEAQAILCDDGRATLRRRKAGRSSQAHHPHQGASIERHSRKGRTTLGTADSCNEEKRESLLSLAKQLKQERKSNEARCLPRLSALPDLVLMEEQLSCVANHSLAQNHQSTFEALRSADSIVKDTDDEPAKPSSAKTTSPNKKANAASPKKSASSHPRTETRLSSSHGRETHLVAEGSPGDTQPPMSTTLSEIENAMPTRSRKGKTSGRSNRCETSSNAKASEASKISCDNPVPADMENGEAHPSRSRQPRAAKKAAMAAIQTSSPTRKADKKIFEDVDRGSKSCRATTRSTSPVKSKEKAATYVTAEELHAAGGSDSVEDAKGTRVTSDTTADRGEHSLACDDVQDSAPAKRRRNRPARSVRAAQRARDSQIEADNEKSYEAESPCPESKDDDSPVLSEPTSRLRRPATNSKKSQNDFREAAREDFTTRVTRSRAARAKRQ